MGDVLPFKKPSLAKKAKAHTLCKSNRHKWQVVTDNQFDVKKGKLVTLFRCTRCGKEKSKGI